MERPVRHLPSGGCGGEFRTSRRGPYRVGKTRVFPTRTHEHGMRGGEGETHATPPGRTREQCSQNGNATGTTATDANELTRAAGGHWARCAFFCVRLRAEQLGVPTGGAPLTAPTREKQKKKKNKPTTRSSRDPS